ncbi:HEAT repeat family protein [Tritrichomonas foetus]|uniref:HEAT repeat family protein n=1 Tax=Tritrichomonas foetus TaxID=1144522 RepID=A0A1J4JZ47_9EUKA|nr:HEAT repeat family protein [Tritrichomonas foetus]|eukprot:OHT04447.1 HEAT repeat family protein [Tritrichomonas foetus]
MNEGEIDLSIPPLARLARYLTSESQDHRIHCTECVIEAASCSRLDDVHARLLPAVEALLNDEDEEVADTMLMMLPDFADTIFEYFPDFAPAFLAQNIIPLVHALISNESEQYAESYASLAIKLAPEYFTDLEVPFLKSIAHDDEEGVRLIASAIVLYLVEHIDPSIWFSGLLEIITTFTSDSSDEVRVKTPPLIALYTKELQSQKEKMQLSGKFSLFVRDTCPEVRTAAAESLVTLCMALDPSSKIIIVIPATKLLLNDQNEETRDCVSKNLGPLVAELGRLADRSLVSQYCTALCSTDPNIAFASAYSFPAVILGIGKERKNEVATAFDEASSSREFRVRRTLAYGLMSFAHLLEKDYLVENAINFLRDIPAVSIGIIESLDRFLEMVPERSSEFFFCLQEPQRYPEWRVRLKVSEQCRLCAKFYKREELLLVAEQLAVDEVWAVRKDAAKSVALHIQKSDISFLEKLSESRMYYERQEAALIISLIEQKWVSECTKIIERLSSDQVANVRIMAANAARVLKHKVLVSLTLMRAIKRLKGDNDVDVIFSIGKADAP